MSIRRVKHQQISVVMSDLLGFTLLASIGRFDSLSEQCRATLNAATLGRAVLLLEITDAVLSNKLRVVEPDFGVVKDIQAEIANRCAKEKDIPHKYFREPFRVIPGAYGRWVHLESILAHRPPHMSWLEYVAAGERYPSGFSRLS